VTDEHPPAALPLHARSLAPLVRTRGLRDDALWVKQVGYTIKEIDFIAAYIARYDAWYLIPIESLGKFKYIRLYPTGRKLKRGGGLYEQYRDAWRLLKDEM
jgi:hypothetical protein